MAGGGSGEDLPPAVPGTALMAIAAVGFGFTPLFARLTYADGLAPEVALVYRFGVPALLLLPFCAAGRSHPKAALTAVALGAGMGLGMVAYFRALAVLPVALPTLVYFTYPAFTLLLGRILFGTSMTPRAVLAAACVLGACGLILTPGALDATQLRALWLCLGAPIGFALLLHGFARWLTALPTPARTGLAIWGQFLVLGPVLVLGAPADRLLPQTDAGWIGIVGLATICSLLPQLLTVIATSRLGAAAAAIAGSLELVTTLAVGWLLLREPMKASGLAGAVLVLVALWLARPRSAESVTTDAARRAGRMTGGGR